MKRTLSLVLALVMLCTVLAACGTTATTTAAPTTAAPTTTKAAGSTTAATTAAPTTTAAGWQPKKETEMVIPASAGGGSDLWARAAANAIAANKLSPYAWVPVNKAGGAAAVGYNYMMSKKGDEYTLLSLHSGALVSSYVAGWEKTFESYIDIIAILAFDDVTLCVNPKGKYPDIKSLLDAAKAAPGTLKFGSDQRLNSSHYGYEMIKKYAGADMNYVQFDSSGDAATALLGGHVDVAILNPAECIGQVKAGTLKPVVTFAEERLTGLFKDAPTFIELGYKDIVMREFRGLAGPVGMPVAAKQYYEEMGKKLMETKEFKDYIEANNLTPTWIGLDKAAAYSATEMSKIADMFKSIK